MTLAKMFAKQDIEAVTLTFHTATGEVFLVKVPGLNARQWIAKTIREGYLCEEEDKTTWHQVVKIEVDAAL